MSSKSYGFSFELLRCSGCMACVTACMDQNDIAGEGPSFRQVSKIEKEYDDMPAIGFVSLACFHCAEAPCLHVCPSGAIFRDEDNGIVGVNQDLCIGCHACVMACPFGAPKFYADGKMMKCNMCEERVANNMDPACVHTCATRALEFGTIEELTEKKAKKVGRKIFQPYHDIY
jgi:anaerobic dimethyl sulfoxide reductase subunit B (iron-sulfur subunit)